MGISMKQYTAVAVGVVIILAVLGGLAWYQMSGAADQAEVRDLVQEFGLQLKNVPLAGDEESVRDAIADYYTPFVTQDLLTSWIADPRFAPGRLTSSPWPDSIRVREISAQGAGYAVMGDIVLMTSVEVATEEDDNAGVVPAVMLVVPTEHGWRLAAFEEQQTAVE